MGRPAALLQNQYACSLPAVSTVEHANLSMGRTNQISWLPGSLASTHMPAPLGPAHPPAHHHPCARFPHWPRSLRTRPAGDVFPTTALDALVSSGNNVLLDIRPAADKEAGGVPDLPDSGERALELSSCSKHLCCHLPAGVGWASLASRPSHTAARTLHARRAFGSRAFGRARAWGLLTQSLSAPRLAHRLSLSCPPLPACPIQASSWSWSMWR